MSFHKRILNMPWEGTYLRLKSESCAVVDSHGCEMEMKPLISCQTLL